MGDTVYIGDFHTVADQRYECHFDPDEKKAYAIGPVPHEEQTVGVAYETEAEEAGSARNRLQLLMGPGRFIGT